MGSLYLAKDPKIGRLVAIKLVRQEFDSPEARQRFAREAQSAGTLRHPNIVTIFDVDEHDGLPFIAMEYVEGETLSEIVRRKAGYSLAARLQWIEELCGGLAYAHRQGVVHRDVKPANLMLGSDGTLKILDFGLARRDTSKVTQSHAIIGTPHYMSPEQIRAGDVGPRSDIFAVGAVLYEVVSYAEAFPGSVHQAMHRILFEAPKPIREIVPDVDPGIEAILHRALEKDPAQRFDDLTVMRTELTFVRQRLGQRANESVETIALTPQATPVRRSGSAAGSAGSGSPIPVPGSGSSGSRRDSSLAHRLTLQKRRAEQIDAHLVEARKHYDTGAFDRARQAIDQALMFDPDHPTGLQLLDELAAEEERRQVAAALAAARTELQQGRLDAAEQLVAQALALAPKAPEALQLRDMIDTTKREIERTRQVQEILRRARARFAEASFEGAIRAAGELLAIDPQNAAARDIEARAHEAIEARATRAERDAAAQSAVAAARVLFEKGDKASAIAALESFTPPHDLVTGFLASLRGEIATDAATVHEPAPSPVPVAPPRHSVVVYAALATIVVFAAAGVYRFTRPAPAEPTTAAASSAPAPALTSTPTPVTPAAPAPPPSLAAQPPRNQSDRDALEAYRLLASGDRDAAAKIIANLARRDPSNEHLPDLRTQLGVKPGSDQGQTGVRPGSDQGQTPISGTQASTPTDAVSVMPPAAKPEQPAALAAAPPPVLPSAPAAPPARTAADVERPAIEATIAEYSKALSNRDLPAVARVRRYTPAEARNWEAAFKNFSEYRLIVKVTGPPVIQGDRATVPVEEQFAQTSKKGGIQVFSQPRRMDYILEKIGEKWMILPPS